MEAEDQAAMEMEEYEGSSDDEQYSLPKEWKEHGFGSHVAKKQALSPVGGGDRGLSPYGRATGVYF